MSNNSLAERLATLPQADREAFLASLTPAQAKALLDSWEFKARPNQLAPKGNWAYWLVLAGRGFGKTRTGAEWIKEKVESGESKSIYLIGPTFSDCRDTMLNGVSGLMSLYPDSHPNRPEYLPSKGLIHWPNGARAKCFTAEKPQRLRGPQCDTAWLDEICAYQFLQETWDQFQFGFRLGDKPQCCITTTPTNNPLLKELLSRVGDDVVKTSGSTYENKANLSAKFIKTIEQRYENTRLGRQELYAELLEDVEGALWKSAQLEAIRVSVAPSFRRVVIAVDPAVTSHRKSDETGIIVAGLGVDGRFYVIADLSGNHTASKWAQVVVDAYRNYRADRCICEVNQGGDLVTANLHNVDPNIPVKAVHATKGKYLRAEPISALYEQGRVSHLGYFARLESEMTSWTPDAPFSPNRVDALVYSLSELSGRGQGLFTPVIHAYSERAYR